MKRLVAILMASAAVVVVLPGAGAWAQSDEGETITLDDDPAITTEGADAGATDDGDEGVDANGATKLKRLVIGGDASGADITNTPAAVSTIDAQTFKERFAGDTNAAIRSTPGAFTREEAEQPGVVVNVRGMQGMGRVNTMIDGVPQTFRNLSGHGGTFDNMAYVDQNLLVGLDINRGSVSGNKGLGTLSGSANFRTIGIDDVLLPGKEYGGMQTLQFGTNGKSFSRLTAAGWKHPLDNEGAVSIVGAVSGSNFGNYKNGDGIEYPYDASEQPSSGLFKLNFAPDSVHSLELGGVWYKNAFVVQSADYDWKINNQTYTAKYAYQPGDNIIDLKVNAYLNITEIDMGSDAGVFDGRSGTNKGIGLDVSNTSTWDVNDETSIKFNYGAAINSDDYKANDQRGANPDGTLVKSGAFLDATLTRGIFGLTTGIRYDAWSLNGVDYLAMGEPGCPVTSGTLCEGDKIDRSGGVWNPKIGATITPRDWLQFYATYSHTMRPPTASEMFYPCGHNFTGCTEIGNNPNLLPERQKGIDIGVNLRGDDLFMSGDSGYVKLGYFHNRISDYITYGLNSATGDSSWINLPGTTTMQGVEIEGGYDIGSVYGKLAVTIADTRQPIGSGAGFGNDVGTLPDDFATLDVGTRFFEQKLTLGTRVRYTGDSIQAFFTKDSSVKRPSYTLVDLYGSWKINDNFSAFVSVQNLLDKGYWMANSGTADMFGGVSNGRGRTIVFGATARF